ncbi:MAG: hypothetical protein FJ011_09665 [Chloroflexi bacterium]|nr:hypothetical protein [Chloroflexota bacterium]
MSNVNPATKEADEVAATPPAAVGRAAAALRRLVQMDAVVWLAWLLPIFAWAPLTYPGYFEFHSGFLPAFNVADLARNLGDLSWAPTVGQPYDLLRGERVLPYLLALLPRALGASPVAAVKWVFAASILAGALGMLGWARRRLSAWPALLAAVVYAYWPLGLATIYVRGAFAEAVFLGLMPCALWAADAVRAAGRPAAAVALTLTLAAALWTQSGLALWLVIVIAVYLAAGNGNQVGWIRGVSRFGGRRQRPADPERRLRTASRPERWAAISRASAHAGRSATAGEKVIARSVVGDCASILQDEAISFVDEEIASQTALAMTRRAIFRTAFLGWLGGILLAAAGLLPLILRRGPGDGPAWVVFADHFVYPHQLLSSGWGWGPSIAGPADTLTFSLGLAACGLVILGWVLGRGGGSKQLLIVLVLAFLASTFAAAIWDRLSFLSRSLTYPWQLLLLAGPWLAWLAGMGGQRLLERLPRAAVGPTADSGPPLTASNGAVPLFAALAALTLLGVYGDLAPPTTSALIPDRPVAIFGQDEIALVSAMPVGTPGPAGWVTLLVKWQALRPLSQDYTVFFHIQTADGVLWGQQDAMPKGNAAPTSRWRPGQVVDDLLRVQVRAAAPIGGDYRYLLGLYQWQTGQRLRTATDDKVVVRP